MLRVAVGSIVDFVDGDFHPVRVQGISLLVGLVRLRFATPVPMQVPLLNGDL